MKNILIIGCPRSGKSTLANMLCGKRGFSLISIDAIVSTFGKIFPDLGMHLEPEKSEPILSKFIFEYMRQLHQENPNRKYVVEGCHLSPETVAKNANLDFFDAICLGYPDLTPEQFLLRVRQTDWATTKPDNEIMQMGEYFIKQTKLHKNACNRLRINFIDTSDDIEKTLTECIKQTGDKYADKVRTS